MALLLVAHLFSCTAHEFGGVRGSVAAACRMARGDWNSDLQTDCALNQLRMPQTISPLDCLLAGIDVDVHNYADSRSFPRLHLQSAVSSLKKKLLSKGKTAIPQ